MNSSRHVKARGFSRMLAIMLCAIFCSAICPSVDNSARAQPNGAGRSKSKGLAILRNAPVRRGQGQRVALKSDGSGDEQVALVHAEVGDRRLVILPNGELESVPIRETKATDAPFRAASKEEIAEQLKADFTGFKTRSTARYVYVYNTSEEFFKGTSRILETMYPAVVAYFKRQKFPVHEPMVPLVAIMFRTEEEFQKFEPVPSGIAAYYSALSNHIVMFEQSKLVEVAPELAVKQSIGTIAHEGVHQILHNIGVQERLSRWPTWVAEGLAEYFAPTSVDRRLRWKGIGTPHDLRMYELDALLKKRPTPHGQLVEKTVGALGLTSSGYATAWGLTHYLATRKKDKFFGYLREVAQLGPLEPRDDSAMAAARKQQFSEFFGSDFASLEDDFVKHLASLPYSDPIANQTHYVVTLDTTSVRTVGVTSSPAEVRKWQENALTKISPAARASATFQVQPFANKTLADEYASQVLNAK